VLRIASRLRREMLAGAVQLDPGVLSPKISSASLGADVPAAVEESDTVDTAETAACATLVGCLRQRWTSTR
jgi:hypothetical protein